MLQTAERMHPNMAEQNKQGSLEDSRGGSVRYVFESIYPNRQMMEWLEKIPSSSAASPQRPERAPVAGMGKKKSEKQKLLHSLHQK